MGIPPILLYIIPVVIILLVAFVTKAYVKASPTTAFIISGFTKEPRILVGKGGFMIPFLERKEELSLSQITIDINTKEPVPTKDWIEVNIDAVAIIEVSKENIQIAAKNYIGKSPKEIGMSVVQTLSGCLREAIGTVEFKELNLNRDAFSKTVMANATTDIKNLGLSILSCNIERVNDLNGLISQLGADNTWKIKKDAAMVKARSEKEIKEVEAEAAMQANDAEVASAEAIAARENALSIKKAELKILADKHQAEADAAYKIYEAEQAKTINEKNVEADIARTIKLQTLAKEEIAIQENKLTAEVNKQADADKYKTETAASAALEKERMDAEARLIKVTKEAEAAEAEAKAKRVCEEERAKGIKAIAEAEAERIRLEGEARATAIQAQGMAEAEALERKAEAFSKYNEAAILDMVAKILPEMAGHIATPLSAIKSLNIYGSDGSGVASVSGNVPTLLKQTIDTIESVGIPMNDMLQAKTKSAATDRNLNISGNGIANMVGDMDKPLNS